jgi:hypothetical protein
MAHRLGCGPLGCLVRGIFWLAGTFLTIVVIVVLVTVGIWLFSPHPARTDFSRLCSDRSIGFAQLNLDLNRPATRDLLRTIEDSIVNPRLARSIQRSPGLLRPLVSAAAALTREYVVPAALPYSVGILAYRGSGPARRHFVLAANSRIPVTLLNLSGIPERALQFPPGHARVLSVGDQSYPVRRFDHALLVTSDNWFLAADSTAALEPALSAMARDAVPPEQFVQLARGAEQTDAAAVLVNQGQDLYELLNSLELSALAASRPADREIVAHLFGQVMALSGFIRTARADVECPDLNSIGVTVRFELQSDDAANRLRGLLRELKPFLDTILARSGMKTDYAAAGNGTDVTLDGRLNGARQSLLRLLLRRLR